jgi:hypothetical protein
MAAAGRCGFWLMCSDLQILRGMDYREFHSRVADAPLLYDW